MRITSKGQVTIPKKIRDEAGLLPHTEVRFRYVRGKVILEPMSGPVPARERAIATLKGSLRDVGMATDEIMTLTRGEV